MRKMKAHAHTKKLLIHGMFKVILFEVALNVKRSTSNPYQIFKKMKFHTINSKGLMFVA